ncbi:uncharacterized protein [Nicotiana sylvestris]|uniref:uncharacterized protein n=1 Tax=Nicotiana sylvestris TaxID=4096 RepID=UPI00388C51A9
MVGKGCLSYLALARDVSAKTPTIDSVLVVRDFLDVFHVYLSGMSPDRDIDFGIDLVTGAQPISIPPYRMAPAKLKELKEQLPKLLDKGFIRTSVSPWVDVQALANRFMRLDISEPSQVLACVVSRSSLFDRIRECKYDDPYLLVLKDNVQHNDARDMTIGDDGCEHIAPYEALYGRQYRSPVGWFEPGEARLLGTNLVQDAFDKVKVIQERLRTAQSRQKSYAERKICDVSYMVGEKVLLKVSPIKGVMRFGNKGKLSPRFIGPFEVLRRTGEVLYKLALPPSLSSVHPIFLVSMLRKYIGDASHILDFSMV